MKQLKKYIVTGIWQGKKRKVECLDFSAKAAISGLLWSKKKATLITKKQNP